jgi:2-polyprenyl-6-hydroxyphenyl methylase/3-demethylubiquinone-9 3-methyltransferase
MTQSLPCKCCGAPAPWFGSADFAKSCEDRRAPVFPLAGWSVEYYRCSACGFLFSDFLDAWSLERQRREIYNDDYGKVDPDLSLRPAKITGWIEREFDAWKDELRIFDYGGGTGETARQLRGRGFRHVESGDPFLSDDAMAPGIVDLMLCVEVFEHLARPDAAFAAAAACLDRAGVVLFSTLLQPPELAQHGTAWWYVAPRNGHVSLHTRKSLAVLAERHGFAVGSFNDTFHMAWRGWPEFAAHIIDNVRPAL